MMIRTVITLLFLCSIISCQNAKKLKVSNDLKEIKELKKKKEVKLKNETQTKIYKSDSIKDITIGGNQKFSFKFISTKDSLHLKRIKIYQSEKLIQTIETNKECYEKKYQFIDWNFDGYKDITVLYNCGATGLCAYWVWNYDPKINKFTYNKQISEWLGIEIDSEEKQIINHYREGANHEIWSFLKYNGEKLKLTKRIDRQIYNYDGVYWNVYSTEEKLTSGVIKSRDSVIITTNNRRRR